MKRIIYQMADLKCSQTIFTLLFFVLIHIPAMVFSQVKNVSVELYYISDYLDESDTTSGRILPTGSKTYRVYVELEEGSALKAVYGDTLHALKIVSTANFFNNIDRPTAYFGYLINKLWFPDNPTLAIDSWLTIGRALKTHYGIPKDEDTDGSFVGGSNNYGGTSGIPGGLLVNADGNAFVPFTTADGYMQDTSTLLQWLDNGFKDMSGTDTTVFGSINAGCAFISNNASLYQSGGVEIYGPAGNKVLIAQLTTTGDLTLELNVVVTDTNGNDIHYVASGNDTTYIIGGGQVITERLCPYLTYPPVCGCTDPNYVEYDPAYGCDNDDSCKTLIVYGCMDPMACNYDVSANFNISSLCCYPGFCNDRDISVVCPYSSFEKFGSGLKDFYPNPANDFLNFEVYASDEQVVCEVYNSNGAIVLTKELGMLSGTRKEQIDLTNLGEGLYLLRVMTGGKSDTRRFIKNQ